MSVHRSAMVLAQSAVHPSLEGRSRVRVPHTLDSHFCSYVSISTGGMCAAPLGGGGRGFDSRMRRFVRIGSGNLPAAMQEKGGSTPPTLLSFLNNHRKGHSLSVKRILSDRMPATAMRSGSNIPLAVALAAVQLI